MRTRAISLCIAGIALAGALGAGGALAQRRAATEAEARIYIYGAFLTHAAHAIVSERVTTPWRRASCGCTCSTT
ncbi:MAG: hypothetical protein ACT4P3_08135 [Betaproteobacteria bacterium]